jgi:alpha-L-rhamnosidase
MRWWWFGPSVTRQELDHELTTMADSGIGGVEVAYVYPLATATTGVGSDAFLADLRFAAERAHELGLSFDVTLGSGWSFGGPHISTELAARQLHWERREIGPAPLEVPVLSSWPGDELITAYVGAGSLQEPPTSFQRLSVEDGRIMIKPGTGPRVVLLAYARLTGQNVKRAAIGAEGPVLDHYSAAATEAHLQAVGDPMLDAVPADLIGSVFCDSLEVYGADWTRALPAEFARRRGYVMLPVLYRLTVDEPGAARLRADYHHTLAELYQENFVAACQRWAAGRNVPFRIQSYRTPPATISSYRFADLFEGEGWGWREITQTRWASSARASLRAHSGFRRGVDLGSFALLPRYTRRPEGRGTRAPPQWRQPARRARLALLAGRCARAGLVLLRRRCPRRSQPVVAGDAGAHEVPRQVVLVAAARRAGVRHRAVCAERGPVRDHGCGAGGSLDTWREANRRIPSAIPAAIRTAGLDYDLIDDDALTITPLDRYRAVIVPVTTMITDAIAAWLDKVIAAGRSVIMIDSAVTVPGAIAIHADGLGDALVAAVSPDLGISPPTPDIGFVHRRLGDTEIYVVINT